MAAVRSQKMIVKAAYQRNLSVLHLVGINPKKLLGEHALLNAIIMIKSSLRSPAYMQCGGRMLLRPVHDSAHLLPVINLLKGDILHRRTGDDQSVKTVILDLFKC